MSLAPWTTWLTQALTQLYHQPSDSSDFTSLFTTIFSPDAVINVNHETLSLSTFEENLKQELVGLNMVLDSKVDWKETFEVPATTGEGGIVAGFFIATRTMDFKIRAGFAHTLAYRFFSAKVVKDEGNLWRVGQFFLAEKNEPAPIRLEPLANQ